jgi:hypothetical protein
MSEVLESQIPVRIGCGLWLKMLGEEQEGGMDKKDRGKTRYCVGSTWPTFPRIDRVFLTGSSPVAPIVVSCRGMVVFWAAESLIVV